MVHLTDIISEAITGNTILLTSMVHQS